MARVLLRQKEKTTPRGTRRPPPRFARHRGASPPSIAVPTRCGGMLGAPACSPIPPTPAERDAAPPRGAAPRPCARPRGGLSHTVSFATWLAIGWPAFNDCWHGNLLHSSPQPNTAGVAARTPIEYSLLQPRSAPEGASLWVTPRATPQAPASPYAPAPCPAAATAACCEARAVRWLGRHPFSELLASAGELLHTPQRIPTFMATALLSLASNVLCGIWAWASTRAL